MVRRLSALALFAICVSTLDTPMFALSPSPDGTRIPTATLIVDNSLATWTLASDRRVLKDGIQAANGYANGIYWLGGTIYVDGLDANWYRWTGSSWTFYGTSAPTATTSALTPSPDQATVPTTTNAIVDSSLATWTLASDTRVLRNGVQAAGGYGTIIYWYAKTIYVFGTDSRWWMWNGSGWTVFGATKPGTTSTGGSTSTLTVSPDRATVPTTTNAIVDSSLATWTLASDTRVLRNGVQAAGGLGTIIYWYANTIYVFGVDSRWWSWNGSGWTVYGASQPGTSSSDGSGAPSSGGAVSPDGSKVPTTTTAIVDSSLATWTLASDTRVLRNGVQAAGGYGTIIYWYANTIYVFGTDSNWWTWNGSGWTMFGPSQPGTSSGGSTAPGTSSGGSSTVTGDYYVSPGQDIQAVLNTAAEGNTIVLRAGVHRMQTLTPKNRQVITGEPGAILSGARRLTSFVWDGSAWMIAGQTQQGPATTLSDTCTAASPLCSYPEDLFIDNVLLKHVATRGELAPGRWYFDYGADQIYIADDPTGHVVETSVTPTAFEGLASSVTVRGLIIEKFASPTQRAALNASGPGWIYDRNEVRFNHAIGLRGGDGATVRNNNVHHNGAMGLAGSGADILVENNEIAFNNTNGYNAYWEAGGTKWVFTNRLVVRGNYSHDNHGPGLWTDINNINTLYENNRVEDNDLSGIFHEISYAAVIRNNTIARNGRVRPSPGWVDGAGILIAGSSDVEVYGNTLTDNFQGIAGLEGHRGSGAYGPWVLQNMNVHDNSVWQVASMPNGAGRTGVIDTSGTGAFFNNNWYARNTYHLGTNANYFIWMGRDMNEATWPTYQQDTTGTFIR